MGAHVTTRRRSRAGERGQILVLFLLSITALFAAAGLAFDVGRFYAPNVVDAYTQPDGTGGVDLWWNVSTWNPYAVVWVHTNLRPPS